MLKVCGNTREQDVLAAQQLGFDAVGFIFAPSPRRVHPESLLPWIRTLSISTVGVFVNEAEKEIRRIHKVCRLDILQLHGDESPEFCNRFDQQIYKAIRVKDVQSLEIISEYPDHVKILLDAYEPNKAGGTGKMINLELLDHIDDFSRIILAGGIGPDNIEMLEQRYHPFGFDVNSQVEVSPGIKDHEKLKKTLLQ